jgi:hypothetical protein
MVAISNLIFGLEALIYTMSFLLALEAFQLPKFHNSDYILPNMILFMIQCGYIVGVTISKEVSSVEVTILTATDVKVH